MLADHWANMKSISLFPSMGHYWASGQTSGGPISKCQYWLIFKWYIGPMTAQCTYVTWVMTIGSDEESVHHS